MALKRVNLTGLGEVTLSKRKGVRAIKLSVSHSGQVKVTMPTWTPYSVGLVFLNNNLAWIDKHRQVSTDFIKDNDRIGKAHQVRFIQGLENQKVKARVVNNEIRVQIPVNLYYESPEVQAVVKKYAAKALRAEAEQLLPQRLNELAIKYGFNYKSVKIKQLKSRWGSCNTHSEITLSFYLMQLPWDLIDYVILHELTHTKVMAHGAKFWDELAKVLPNVKSYRKAILKYRPVVTVE